MAFREKIINAKRKLIAHLDLRARLQPLGLGEFSEAEEEGFWAALQAFVDAAHSEAIGGPYDISATMVDRDVANLIHSLKEAVDYNYLVVAYFAYANPGFNRGRSIYTKTIFHENSLKKGYSEWVHPDMVGFYLPIEDWRPEVIEFNRLSDNNSIRLFSFELKRSLNKSNYRESYFQAVSNSSWAHEGYLVAAEVLQDDNFLAELERLAVSFGIGIVQLEIQDIDSSSVLYPARVRPALDWETINKLCEQNRDFEKFVQDVKIDFESKRIHRAEYDEVPKDAAQYIREKLKIEQAAAADG